MTTKRRLELMPEVLPAPIKVDTNPGAVSPVRARTMQRLRALAAVGASIAAACGGGTTGASSSGGTSGGGTSGGGPDGGLPDATKPDAEPGYGVVDPLPPPACFEYANPPKATISLVTVEDAGVDASADPDAGDKPRYARLLVTWPQKDVAVGDITQEDDSTTAIVESNPTAGNVEIVLRQPGNTGPMQARLAIKTSCAKGPTTVRVSISEDSTKGLQTQVSFEGF